MTGRSLARAALAAALLAGGATPSRGQGFALMQGADTVAVERVTRGPGTLEGELQMRQGQPVTLRYRANPGADALVSSMTVEAGGAAAGAGVVSVTFRGDSAFAEVGGT